MNHVINLKKLNSTYGEARIYSATCVSEISGSEF